MPTHSDYRRGARRYTPGSPGSDPEIEIGVATNPTPRIRSSEGVSLELTTSGSLLGRPIPVVYGTGRVTCGLGFLEPVGDYLYGMWPISHGELPTITGLKFNGQDASDVPGVTNYVLKTGQNSQSAYSYFDGKLFGGLTTTHRHQETYPGIAYVGAVMRWRQRDGNINNIAGSLDITVETTGRKVYDFRDSTWKVSANPVLIAYDIETDDRAPWLGRDGSAIDVANWTEWADYCDEDPGDGSARFEFNGAIAERDIEKAQAEVLRHCHARVVNYGGVKYIIGDKPPPKMKRSDGTTDATYSGSSYTLTEDATDGQATSELRVGSVIWDESNNKAVVTEVTDDDTVVVDVDVSSWSTQKIRYGSSVHLNSKLWVSPPTGKDSEKLAAPDVVWINYRNPDTWKSDRWEAVDPTTVPHTTDYVKSEATYQGCTSASQAERHGQLQRRLIGFENNYWQGRFRGEAIRLFPGDICRGTFGDGTDEQVVRIIGRTDHQDDTVTLQMREYDPSAYSDDYASEDTPPTVTYPWIDSFPESPSAATQAFGEHGYFGFLTKIPDKDDMTATGGWYVQPDANFIVTDMSTYTSVEVTSYLSQFYITRDVSDALAGKGIGHLSLITAWDSNPNESFRVLLEYRTGATEGTSTVKGYWFIPPYDDNDDDVQQRFIHNWVLDNEDYQGISFRFEQLTPNPSPNWPKITFRQIRLFGIGVYGETENIDNAHSGLQYYERWGWTEGAGADNNAEYQLLVANSGGEPTLVATVPRDPEITELKIWLGDHIYPIDPAFRHVGISPYTATPATPRTASYMRAVNSDGAFVSFPAATQSVEEESPPVALLGDLMARSIAASNDLWWHLYSLPAYDDADNHQVVHVELIGGNGPDCHTVEEFIITNDGEATEAQVIWRRFTEGTEGIGLTVRRQVDGTDQIHVVAKSSVQSGYNTLLARATVMDYEDAVRTIYAGMDNPTTTAPTAGSETFDSLTDEPQFEFHGKTGDFTAKDGCVYADKTSTPTIAAREGGDGNSFTCIQESGGTGYLFKIEQTGNSHLRIDGIPGDGTSESEIAMFRLTNTSGTRKFIIYKGDGSATVQHTFSAAGDVDLCQNAGKLTAHGVVYIDDPTNPSIYFRENGSATYQGLLLSDGAGHFQIRSYGDASAVGVINLMPWTAGANAGHVRMFAPSSNNSAVYLQLYKGDGTWTERWRFSGATGDINHYAGHYTLGGGNLYVDNATTPTIYLREGGSVSNYTHIYNTGSPSYWTYIRTVRSSGGATLQLSAVPVDGSSAAVTGINYQTSTTGNSSLRVYDGAATKYTAHEFFGDGNAVLCQTGGALSVEQNIYCDKTSTPAIQARENADANSYTGIEESGTTGYLKKYEQSGVATLRIDAVPNNGTSASSIEFYRITNTSGTRLLTIYKGDGSNGTQHSFNAGTGEVKLALIAGDVKLGLGGGYTVIGTPGSSGAPLSSGSISMYLDETNHKLMFEVKYSGGTTKSGSVALT